MLELKHDTLDFSFPEVHEEANISISFRRTLRIPDDNQIYALPPGLGNFPLRHVDDFADRIPENWRQHGGVMMPMYQSEAMWISFRSFLNYPFLVKIATGKVNAVTGDDWVTRPVKKPQDYLVIPDQPWLDGYCVEEDVIRQFVAMPLGDGYTAEEQITGEAVHGGIQIVVYPMKAKEREKIPRPIRGIVINSLHFCLNTVHDSSMGLAAGGRMTQQIHEDPHGFGVWDLNHMNRCFVHIANSVSWRAITGEAPPTVPPTAAQYSNAGLPWFQHYRPDAEVLDSSEKLEELESVLDLWDGKGACPLPENESLDLSKKEFSGLLGQELEALEAEGED